MTDSVVVYKATGSSANDDQAVFTVVNADRFDTFTFGSTAGVMDVFVSGDGSNELATPVSLVDLTSTTPSTFVAQTEAGKSYGLRGSWRTVVFRQKGATAVANAFLVAR